MCRGAGSSGSPALALTRRRRAYGAVKAHLAAKERGLKLVLASQLTLTDAPPVIVYAQDADGLREPVPAALPEPAGPPQGRGGARLARAGRALERAHRAAAVPGRGRARWRRSPRPSPGASTWGCAARSSAGDEARWAQARALARTLELPLLRAQRRAHPRRAPAAAAGRAHRHPPPDATVDQRGHAAVPQRRAHAEGPGGDAAGCFRDAPEAVGRTLEIADRCHFTLDELRYQFPEEDLPPGPHRPSTWLRS